MLMSRVSRSLMKFAQDERGLESVEWAIIVALIVAAAVTAIGLIGTWTKAQFDSLQTLVGADA